MSVIAGISVVVPQVPPATVAVGPNGTTSQALTASQPPATGGTAAQPAVVISLSSGAAAVQTSPTLPSLDPNEVDDALSWAAGANGFAANYERGDWSALTAKFGSAVATRDKTEALAAASGSASQALSYGSSLGIPIQESVNSSAVTNGAAPGTITIGAFSFTSGGSIYSVTPGANGALVGTKDGQAWETWQLVPTGTSGNVPATDTDSGAAAALQALTSLNARLASAHGQSPLDIVA